MNNHIKNGHLLTVPTASGLLKKIPLVDRLERNSFEAIRSGDFVRVDADKGSVTVTRN